MKAALELEDNAGNFYLTTPPGEWKDFFDQMVVEKGKGKNCFCKLYPGISRAPVSLHHG
jgi:hypothetical protein